MGVRFICDGCDGMIPDGVEPVEVGTVLRRQYCEKCGEAALGYTKEVNEAHTRIAQLWENEISWLRRTYTGPDATPPLKLLPDA